jgi:hypothetical protein
VIGLLPYLVIVAAVGLMGLSAHLVRCRADLENE